MSPGLVRHRFSSDLGLNRFEPWGSEPKEHPDPGDDEPRPEAGEDPAQPQPRGAGGTGGAGGAHAPEAVPLQEPQQAGAFSFFFLLLFCFSPFFLPFFSFLFFSSSFFHFCFLLNIVIFLGRTILQWPSQVSDNI